MKYKIQKAFIAKLLVFAMGMGTLATTQVMDVEAASVITTIYEAEDEAVCDVTHARKIHTGTSSASGGKSATMYQNEYITYTIPMEESGEYEITMNCAGAANPSGSTPATMPLEIKVGDGEAVVHDVTWTSGYNTFVKYTFSAELVEGDNTIVIKNVSEDATIFANVDYISIDTPAAPGEEVSTTYEAENGDVCDSSTATKIHTGTTSASGGKAATIYDTQYITYTVDVAEDGVCDIKIRYAGAANPAGVTPATMPFEITIGDGEAEVHDVVWTGGYNTFTEYKFSAELVAGENTIVIKNVSGDATIFANIDYIVVTENPQPYAAVPAVGTVEAEDAETIGGSIGTNTAFSGGKYVEAMNVNVKGNMSLAKYLTYQVEAENAGYYKVTAHYATSSDLTKFAVKVNDGEWQIRYVESTGAWNVLSTEEYVIELAEGVNTITVTGSLDSGWVILDKFVMEETTEAPITDSMEAHEPEEGEVKKTAAELQEEGLVSFRGRNMTIGDSVTFDYSASGFEFKFEGEGNIKANFTMTANEKFAVDVDGTVSYYPTSNGDMSITLAEGLEAGTHTIKVYKTQEAMTGLAQLNYLTYDEDATLEAIETDYSFLIIGASSTCGNQIDPDTGAENGYLAFPSVISRAYNATWQQISCSGRGVVQGTLGEDGWKFSQNGMLAEMYGYQSWFRDKETEYDTDSFTPDVIITNFNNDFSGGTRAQGYDVDEIFEHMLAFIGELRETYPDAYIAMTYGNYPTYESDGTYNNPMVIEGYKEAVAKYKEETGDALIDFIQFPSLTGGKSGHPSEEDHQYLAELVSAKVSEALDVENPLPLTHFEVEYGELVNAGDTGKVNTILNWTSSVSKHSNNTYVEGMNVDLAGEAIAADGSNVKYVAVPITVAKTGYYKIEVNYGTDQTPVIYVRADGSAWKELALASTTDWNKIGQNAEYTVFLTAGEHIIDVTGGTTGAYANLDRIDTIFVRSETTEETAIREKKAELKEVIAEAEALDAEAYTEATWTSLETALAMAKMTWENASATLANVELVLSNLNTAVENLEEVTPEPVENPFGDVKESEWFYPYVMFAYKYDLMGGKGTMPDGSLKFDPANTITRAEFVQMLYSKEGKPAVEYVDTFTDVAYEKWYTDAILWAAEEEIVGGKKADFFDVNGKITRQEIALILYKYALYNEYNTEELVNADFSGFADASKVATWAETGMKWAVKYNVIGGKNVGGETLLSPGGNATRAEAATMMKAFMGAYEGVE